MSHSLSAVERLIVAIVIEDDCPLSVLWNTVRQGFGELPAVDVSRTDLVNHLIRLAQDGVVRVTRSRYRPDSGEFDLVETIPISELADRLRMSEAWFPPVENPDGDQFLVALTENAYGRFR